MADLFDKLLRGLASPAENAFAITPDDNNDLATHTRGIWVGGAGDIVLTLARDGASVTFAGAVAGTVIPVRAKRVHSTDTTATNLVGLY